MSMMSPLMWSNNEGTWSAITVTKPGLYSIISRVIRLGHHITILSCGLVFMWQRSRVVLANSSRY